LLCEAAGFFELDTAAARETKLRYFGRHAVGRLLRAAIPSVRDGRGLGRASTGIEPVPIRRKFGERKRERFLSADELARLADAFERAEGKEPTSAIAAIRLLILTGCRLSEILSLRWEWIDFERGCLILPDSKTGAKTVPLGAPALRALAEMSRQGSPYVLPAERGDGHFVGIQKPWQRIRGAGLEDVRIHDLRHSFELRPFDSPSS
jgi:integrase